MRHVCRAAFLALMLLGCQPLAASILTYVITPGPGTYDYLFTLTNDGPDAIFDLFIRVPIDSSNLPASTANDGTGWVAPPGWESFFSIGPDVGANTTFLDWPDASPADDLQPGAPPLTGFGFTSTVFIFEPIQYSVNFSTSDFFLAEGQVPETATAPLTALGMAILAVVMARRKKAC